MPDPSANVTLMLRAGLLGSMLVLAAAVLGCGSEPAVRQPNFVSPPAVVNSPAPIPTSHAAAVSTAPSATAQASNEEPQRSPAPMFELPSTQGGALSLTDLLEERDAAVLVFYRGFF